MMAKGRPRSVFRAQWPRLLPAVTVLSLCLLAVRPILHSSFPCSDDIAFHLFRMVQLDSLWDQGIFHARWAPDMALNYGLPFFNFYAPLSYYVALLISRVGFGLVWGLRIWVFWAQVWLRTCWPGSI